MINATLKTITDDFQVVEFTSTEPSYGVEAIAQALDAVSALSIDLKKGVIISHRGAIWLHSAVAHEFHASAWVAHLDPRLGGGVVVQSHKREVLVGDIIDVPN